MIPDSKFPARIQVLLPCLLCLLIHCGYGKRTGAPSLPNVSLGNARYYPSNIEDTFFYCGIGNYLDSLNGIDSTYFDTVVLVRLNKDSLRFEFVQVKYQEVEPIREEKTTNFTVARSYVDFEINSTDTYSDSYSLELLKSQMFFSFKDSDSLMFFYFMDRPSIGRREYWSFKGKLGK